MAAGKLSLELEDEIEHRVSGVRVAISVMEGVMQRFFSGGALTATCWRSLREPVSDAVAFDAGELLVECPSKSSVPETSP